MIKKLFTILQSNCSKKSKFAYFYDRRDYLKNWLALYCIYSSLTLDILEILIRKFKVNHLFKRWQYKAVFADGVVIYHPVTTRFLGIAARLDRNYFDDYQKLFNDSVKLEKDDVVIDIGAHVGSFAIPVAKKFGTRVLIYEPDQGNVACIVNNIRANGLSKEHVKVYPKAVSSENGEAEFLIGDSPTTGSLMSANFFLRNKKNKKHMVKTVTLDSIFSEHDIKRCKLLKMDCEGSEHLIFQHMNRTLLAKIDYLFMEVHPLANASSQDLIEGLRQDFDVRVQTTGTQKKQDTMYEVFARKR